MGIDPSFFLKVYRKSTAKNGSQLSDSPWLCLLHNHPCLPAGRPL